MSNTALTDWLTFVPAGTVGRARAYIDLPAFSYDAVGTVGDASQIVAQFNFSASRDFYLLTRPTKPEGVNYGLCIRYRIGTTVYRYKLWEDDLFILSSATLSYSKNLIKKNFVLEVWNFAGVASSQAETIRMITSVRTAPTDFRDISDYALAVGAEFLTLDNTNTYALPTTGLVLDMNADTLAVGAITSWIDSQNVTNFIGTATCAQDTKFNAKKYVNFNGTTDYLAGTSAAASGVGPFDIWMAFSKWGNATASKEYLYNSAHGDLLGIAAANSTQGLLQAAGNFISPFAQVVDEELILETILRTSPDVCSIQKDDDTPVTGTLGAFQDWLAAQWFIGKGAVGFTKLNIARLVIYAGEQSADDRLATRQYLAHLYQGAIALPATFNEDAAWLDNTP